MADQRVLNEVAAGLEASYRQGFVAGWQQALDAAWLLAAEGQGMEEAYEVAGEFCEDVLQAWAQTNPHRRIPVPSLTGE